VPSHGTYGLNLIYLYERWGNDKGGVSWMSVFNWMGVFWIFGCSDWNYLGFKS
jgi:hypothetical protein